MAPVGGCEKALSRSRGLLLRLRALPGRLPERALATALGGRLRRMPTLGTALEGRLLAGALGTALGLLPLGAVSSAPEALLPLPPPYSHGLLSVWPTMPPATPTTARYGERDDDGRAPCRAPRPPPRVHVRADVGRSAAGGRGIGGAWAESGRRTRKPLEGGAEGGAITAAGAGGAGRSAPPRRSEGTTDEAHI
jgi:hypothetical protein